MAPRLPVMTESPFAPLTRYISGSRVEHDLDQRYPALIARMGSCAKAGSSVSLCRSSDPRSSQVAVSPCCIQLLPSVISADLSSDAWTPTTVVDKVRLPVSSPVTSAFPNTSLGRLNHNSAQRLLSGSNLRGCSHSIIFRPPSLLPPRSFPPLDILLDARAAVAFTSEQNAARCLTAHRIC